MALKPDRIELDTDISYFMNTVIERGVICIQKTGVAGGSGAAMDQSVQICEPTGHLSSGTNPVGLLLNDMVNLDLTRQHINWHQDEVQFGGKVTLLRRGQVTTNAILSTALPTGGQLAYYTAGTYGTITNAFVLATTNPNTSANSQSAIGRFMSRKDEDGYAKVAINI